MTLASAIALRSDSGTNLVVTLTDSRLGVVGENSTYTDAAIKSFGLGPKSAVLVAGSTLPVVTAVEGTRGLIANANALRAESGRSGLSLLEEARQFVSFFAVCCNGLADVRFSTSVLVAGFFADTVPGIVKLTYSRGSFDGQIFRPPPGDFALVTIGDRYASGIVTHAIGRQLAAGTTGQALFERAGSVFWDVINHAGMPAVGGGLAIGLCRAQHSCWQWPMVVVDQQSFYRGLPITRVPDEWKASAISLTHDPTVFAQVEAEQPATGYSCEYPAPLATGNGFEVKLVDWVPTAEEASILAEP